MIVRVAAEGQYELDAAHEQRLRELDEHAHAAVEAGDEARFSELWSEILEFIEEAGRPLDDDALVASDLILPPRDVSFDEARRDFSGEGLIPD